MFNSLDVLDDLVPVSELSNGRTSAVLNKAEQKQVLKGIAKVSENPLPSSQGGYGKPLRNANRAHLAGLCKIKFRDLGIRVVYKPVLKEGTMVIIVVGVRTDGEAYLKADERRGRHAL